MKLRKQQTSSTPLASHVNILVSEAGRMQIHDIGGLRNAAQEGGPVVFQAGADPATDPQNAQLYVKTVGTSELFVKDSSGSVVQLTNAGTMGIAPADYGAAFSNSVRGEFSKVVTESPGVGFALLDLDISLPAGICAYYFEIDCVVSVDGVTQSQLVAGHTLYLSAPGTPATRFADGFSAPYPGAQMLSASCVLVAAGFSSENGIGVVCINGSTTGPAWFEGVATLSGPFDLF